MSSPIKLVSRPRLVGVLTLFLAVLSVCATAIADPAPPSTRDSYIAFNVSALLRRDHLTRHPLDNEISQRCLKTFIGDLDPWKLYFYQSDIDRFMLRQNDLDDLAQKRSVNGFLGFAHMVFMTLLERIDQRAVLVDEFLAEEHDFTIDEEMLRDRDEATYAQNEAEAREKWRKRIKFDFLSLKLDEIEGEEAVNKLKRRYDSIFRRMHQIDSEELLEMFLTSLTTAFDPHTSYMSPDTVKNFEILMSLELEGIGAALQSVDGETVVKRIIPDGAADKDGQLKVEDKIVGVGQGPEGEIEDVVNMKLSDVVGQIRGPAGSIVRLEVTPGDSPDLKIIEITRAKIELTDSEARYKIFEEGLKPDGQPNRIGVIDLPSFYMDMEGARRRLPDYKSTTRDVRRILKELNDENVDAVVLDLRRNGGGSLKEAIELTGLFIDRGPIVQVKDVDGEVLPQHDPYGGSAWKGPLVVLISKFSASASEILAGAVQDYHRGLIVGDRATHGKGTVQSLMDLSRELLGVTNTSHYGALKITMQQFYRPSGDSTQNRGVLADVELPSLTTHLDVGEADLDYSVPFDRVKPVQFDRLSFVSNDICDRLSQLSSQRRQESDDFQKVLKSIDRYLERKEQKTVTLNEAKFMAEMEELNADKEEKETIEEMSDSGDNGIERNFYLDEAMAITVDYLELLNTTQSN